MKPKYFGILFIIFSYFLKLFIPEYTNCTMINYGGYSGFWYYYGKLQKNYYLDKDIFCYSAGCLAVVANIQHNNIQSINKIVKDLKKKKNNRYDIRNEFIFKICEKIINIKYYNLNILTSNYLGNCDIIKPTNNYELINALNMTSSIPLITSKINLSQNIDGFFCINKYPRCIEQINLPKTFYFYKNIFNHNLNENDINYIMNYN